MKLQKPSRHLIVKEILKTMVREHIDIKQACEIHNVPVSRFYGWCGHDKEVKNAFDKAKEIEFMIKRDILIEKNISLLEKKLEGFTYTERKQIGTPKKGSKEIQVDKIELTEKKLFAGDALQWNLLKSLNPEHFKEEQNVTFNSQVPLIMLNMPKKEIGVQDEEIIDLDKLEENKD